MNLGFLGKGNASSPEPLREQVRAGAIGLKLHEDWGTTPAAIDTCLGVADELDVQVAIHTDTLNESGFVEDTLRAIKGRTIHTYHSEGAGGGHAPDIIKVCGEANVLPSSTNPTRPFTANTIDEHLDMLMVCHHLDSKIPEDVAFAESRIRPETIAAEDILHDLGAFSMISSDSQAMGRVGEVILRTWQTAHKMKSQFGALAPDASASRHAAADNFRALRYIAKYTINPAITHGIAQEVGSIEVGKFADLVLWKPAFFGVKPELILKGGLIACANMGDPNASIPTPQPTLLPPAVRRAWPREICHVADLREPGGAGVGRSREPGICASVSPPSRDTREHLQARPPLERRAAQNRGRSRDLHREGRRPRTALRTGEGAARWPSAIFFSDDRDRVDDHPRVPLGPDEMPGRFSARGADRRPGHAAQAPLARRGRGRKGIWFRPRSAAWPRGLLLCGRRGALRGRASSRGGAGNSHHAAGHRRAGGVDAGQPASRRPSACRTRFVWPMIRSRDER